MKAVILEYPIGFIDEAINSNGEIVQDEAGTGGLKP